MPYCKSFGALLWLLTAALAFAQQPGSTAANRVELGRLANGVSVVFVRAGAGDWGLEIEGGTVPRLAQPKPARLEVYHTDEYLDWAVPSYAKLYQYTRDSHYLDVARILLHDTKFMVALPGRQYDMRGVGWQQEGWRMGPGGSGRGTSGHRFWLPWVSANHLHGITGLEALDKNLYQRLAKGD